MAGAAAIPAIVATTSETIHCCSVGREVLGSCSLERDMRAARAPSDSVCACSDAPVCWIVTLKTHDASASTEVRMEPFDRSGREVFGADHPIGYRSLMRHADSGKDSVIASADSCRCPGLRIRRGAAMPTIPAEGACAAHTFSLGRMPRSGPGSLIRFASDRFDEWLAVRSEERQRLSKRARWRRGLGLASAGRAWGRQARARSKVSSCLIRPCRRADPQD